MSLPAASVAILVLAWDETTPAVRALVDATAAPAPVVDSVVVVVPSGTAGNTEPSQEEFLPLAAAPELLAPTPPSAPEAPVSAEAGAAEAATLTVAAPAIESLAVAAAPALVAPAPAAAAAASTPPAAARPAQGRSAAAETASPGAPPLPVWTAVRVLRLSSFSLPALAAQAGLALPPAIWTGPATAPAAPYVGSEILAAEITAFESQLAIPAADAVTQALGFFENAATAPSPASSPAALPAAPLAQPTAATALPPTYLSGDLSGENGDLEEDDLPLTAAATLPPEPANLFAEAAPAEPLATDFVPEQAGWPEALAALQQPAAASAPGAPGAETPSATSAAPPPPPEYPALLAAANAFEASNLNFQVIQYARFAVPLALAEAEFTTIYAPAWPTWLAAQELRQRTGRPLVLHVSTLAAAADESVETAAGWPAELQRQALHRADLILTETPALAQRLRHDLALPAGVVRAVPTAEVATIAQAVATAQRRPTTNQG